MKRIPATVLAVAVTMGALLICITSLSSAEKVDAKAGVMNDTLQQVRARGKLVLGVPSDDPPFGFDEKGILKGIDIDIGEALSEEIFGEASKIEFVRVSVDNMLDLLRSGKVDILLVPMTITAERKKELDFSIPYLISSHLVLTEKDSKISSYRDLAGKSVAVMHNTAGDAVVAQRFPMAKRVQFQHNSEALQALKEHRVDAFVCIDAFAFYMEEKDRSLAVVELRPLDVSHIGLGFRKGDEQWRDFVDITLLKMVTTGEYHRLLEKWFGRARAAFLELALRQEMKKRFSE